MAKDTETAAAAHDRAALAKYGRFLPAFWEELHRKHGLMPQDAPVNVVSSNAGVCAR